MKEIARDDRQDINQLSISPLRLKRALEYLESLEDPRRDVILNFHETHRSEIETSRGSNTKHQAWEGGYIDHLAETFRMAEIMYEGIRQIYDVSFSFDSAVIVLYFHDVEKIWKYTTGLPEGFDKDKFLFETLASDYNIEFTDDEKNALLHIHGENEHYDSDERLMGRLGALVHCADTWSARGGFDQGKGLG